MNFCSDNLSRMFEDGGTPVFCCDEDWNILRINDCMKREYPDYGIGFNAKAFSDRNAAFFLNAYSRLSNGLHAFSTKFEILSKKSTIYAFSVQDDNEVKPVYFCVLQAPEEEEIPLMAVTDSYRAPITDILSASTVLTRKFEEREDYTGLDYLNHIIRCCYSMLRTTTQTQTYYKLTDGKYPINKKKLSINDFMIDLCKTLDVFFMKTEYIFSHNILAKESQNIISDIDEDLLALAIFHLIANGCNFSPKGSRISLSLSKSENENAFCITVTDEGDGIKTENLKNIFEPFYFFRSSPVPESRFGLGLGLPIVKAITEIHNGLIVVNSSENKATSIVLKIPIANDEGSTLVLKSNAAKYFANKFSNSYIVFSDICDIRFC